MRGTGLFVVAVGKGVGEDVFGGDVGGGEVLGSDVDGGGVSGLDVEGNVVNFGGAPGESVGGAVRITFGSKYAQFGQLPSVRHCWKTASRPSQPSKLSKLVTPITSATLQ